MDHEQCEACKFDGSDYHPAQLLAAIQASDPNG